MKEILRVFIKSLSIISKNTDVVLRKIEFKNELSYEERNTEDGRVKTSFNIEKLALKGKEMDRMIFESKYIMDAISNIKKQILGQVEIK